jgi:hypothetical protein
MGPVPGLSWTDVLRVVAALAIATVLLTGQWLQANSVARTGAGRKVARIALVGLLVPQLLALTYGSWLDLSEPVRAGALALWLGGSLVVHLVAAARRDRWSEGPGAGSVRLNALADASPANVLHEPVGHGARPPVVERKPSDRRSRRSGVLVPAILAIALIAPRAIADAATLTPCEGVEALLATGESQPITATPEDWMPSGVGGYVLRVDEARTLENEARSRVNPDESRIELVGDGFVRGHHQAWSREGTTIEFGAQEFATVEGALAFHAFANRYACQFANETFHGPSGSIGLQIRYRSGRPIGEQLSWVSGSTRILVFVDHATPPVDHGQVVRLVELVHGGRTGG